MGYSSRTFEMREYPYQSQCCYRRSGALETHEAVAALCLVHHNQGIVDEHPARLPSRRDKAHQSGATGTSTATPLAKPPPMGNRGVRQYEARNDHQQKEKPRENAHMVAAPNKPLTRSILQVGVC